MLQVDISLLPCAGTPAAVAKINFNYGSSNEVIHMAPDIRTLFALFWMDTTVVVSVQEADIQGLLLDIAAVYKEEK